MGLMIEYSIRVYFCGTRYVIKVTISYFFLNLQYLYFTGLWRKTNYWFCKNVHKNHISILRDKVQKPPKKLLLSQSFGSRLILKVIKNHRHHENSTKSSFTSILFLEGS